jgi:hypothetical protein
MLHINMVDTVGHSRNSRYISSDILVGYIPKGEQRPWRSVEDRSLANTEGVVVSVSVSGQDED